MECLNKKLDQIFNNLTFITPWLLRLGLGVSFIFHGYGKFPLPPQKLIDYFGFSETLASFVAIAELTAGVLLILGGFIKNHLGELVTRFGAILIVIIMIVALGLAHRDWFITPKLFKSIDVKIIYLGVFWFAMFWIIIGGAFKFYYMNYENFSAASIYGSITLIGGHVVVIAGAKIGALFHVK